MIYLKTNFCGLVHHISLSLRLSLIEPTQKPVKSNISCLLGCNALLLYILLLHHKSYQFVFFYTFVKITLFCLAFKSNTTRIQSLLQICWRNKAANVNKKEQTPWQLETNSFHVFWEIARPFSLYLWNVLNKDTTFYSIKNRCTYNTFIFFSCTNSNWSCH